MSSDRTSVRGGDVLVELLILLKYRSNYSSCSPVGKLMSILCFIIKTSNQNARIGKTFNTNSGMTVASQEVYGELVSCAIVSEHPMFLSSSRTPP